MHGLVQDFRFGIRSLIRNPLVSGVAVVTLALGIGATTAIFGIVSSVLLRALPYHEADRLVMIWATMPKKDRDTVVPADFLDWRREIHAFEELAGFSFLPANLNGGDHPEKVQGVSVTANFFTALGVRPAVGRVFTPGEGMGADGVAVLSDGLWRRAFGADRGLVGRSIKVNGRAVAVLGVMPREFAFPQQAELWMRAPRDVPGLAVDVGRDVATMRGLSYMRAFGRLAAGVPAARAQAELDAAARRQARQYPDTNGGRGAVVVPLYQQLVGDVRPALLVLLGGVVVLLAIACANVANLLVARAAAREREIAVRSALGAQRWRLMRQLLVESVLMSLLAGALGLLLAAWGVKVLLALAPENVPRLGEAGIDPTILAFCLGVALAAGVLLGLLPAVHATRSQLTVSLKQGGARLTQGAERLRLRGLLVIAQVALALTLSIAAGLLVKSFARLQDVRPGFNANGTLSFQITLPEVQYRTPRQRSEFFTQALERVRALAGVQSAAAVLTPPLGGDDINIPFTIAGQPRPRSEEEQRDGFQVVSADYFRTLAIPVLRGRGFSAADMTEDARSAIVSAAMARRYWEGRDPIGQRITYDKPASPDARWRTVVGVVGDVRHFGLDRPARAEAYVPFPQLPWSMMFIVVRGRGNPSSLLPAIRAQIAALDPDLPIAAVSTGGEMLARSYARQRFTSTLLGVFSAVSLLLAAVGLYALVAYAMARRTHEIGIRMVLGARRREVIEQAVRRGMRLAVVGVACGLLGALALTRLLRGLLFEVTPTDLATFVALPLVLLGVSLLANALPALRASRIDPVIAIRDE